jgi:DoxX-like protein
MSSDIQGAAIGRGRLWSARIMSALAMLFLLLDAVIHLIKPAAVVDAFIKLGYPLSASVGIGVVELLCLVLYAAPRTAVLGAILLTGLLGGAISTHVRVGDPVFDTYIFPAIVGLLVWGGIWLRNRRLRALVPFSAAE